MESLMTQMLQVLAHGLTQASWVWVLAYTLVTTHVTIIGVTLYLHRSQAHRSLDLHPVVSHFLRFWLWIGTGMQTKEWVAIHRKHHAKCETADDPHSPQTRGIKKVFWQGAELYRDEAKNADTLARYSHGTPDDWVERQVYSRFKWQGVGMLLIANVLLFGAIGLAVWAVQMLWIPVHAAGVINGIGHYWGYRNFEVADASRNIMPWGLVIGGEELHNNHHTYPTSAKFSVKPMEFDIGWLYIRLLSWVKLATVKKTPPKLAWQAVQGKGDHTTLEAVITHRYTIMAQYAKHMRQVCNDEMVRLKHLAAQKAQSAMPHAPKLKIKLDLSALQAAKRWLHRDSVHIPVAVTALLHKARTDHPVLDTMANMREELRELWQSTHASRDQLAHDLDAWCRRAQNSGIEALAQFALKLQALRMEPRPA